MDKQNDDFLKRLLMTFQVEADEHLKAMSAGLSELEKHPDPNLHSEIVENIFRESHSLKGAARSVNLIEIVSICQALESVFSALKSQKLFVSPSLFDLLYQSIDDITRLIAHQDDAKQVKTPQLIRRLELALKGIFEKTSAPREVTSADIPMAAPSPPAITPLPPETPTPIPHIAETIRVSTHKLDAVMRQAEELLSPRLAAAQRAQELREILGMLVNFKKQQSRIRPVLRQVTQYVEKQTQKNVSSSLLIQELSQLLKYVGYEQQLMKTLEQQLQQLSKFATRDVRTLVSMSDSLLHDVKEMQLLPFSSTLEVFPRATREMAREQGKQIELVIKGGEIEIDRHILEGIKAPLMHLLRNAIDHGIELPAIRQATGKPTCGTLTLSLTQKDSGKIEIVLSDDGGGIDIAAVKSSACKNNLISAEEAEKLSAQEIQSLIFQAGLSTSAMITDISGRGLGLAIVREKIEHLGGTIALESHWGKSTAFRMALPLMLSTFRGVLVRVHQQRFVIPSLSVERVTQIALPDILTVENQKTIVLGGQAIALVSLSNVLELPTEATTKPLAKVTVFVLGEGQQRIAFGVDEVLGEHEVLVKTLGPQLARVRNIVGACVLGTGQVVAVLNVSDLLKSAIKQSALKAMGHVIAQKAVKRSILVADDSITSRALIKNILESAGYLVTTAVDGSEAYSTLKEKTFDLLVSDVEMPYINGFDLTVKVRADKQLSDLPVVLVTGLDTRAHREHGMDTGANAYIVKSSFDQSNLLAVVQRLLHV